MTNEREFKAFYIVLTQNFRWGKSLNLKEAMKNAGLQSGTNSKTKFGLYIGLVKGLATPEILANICQCFQVTQYGGVSVYLDPSQEDQDQINQYFIGWVQNTDFTGQ